MIYIERRLEKEIRRTLERKKSVLLFGARQTGKTTMMNRFRFDLSISLAQLKVRLKYEQNPQLLMAEVEKTYKKLNRIVIVLIDEVQKVPILLDAVQDLIDRQIGIFILTGSSARKLRRGPSVNLLPGRVVAFHLDPLTYQEYADIELENRLLYGALPGIVLGETKPNREEDLYSYVTTYLEEEVRAEAIVRNLGAFGRFLELAASESGKIVNFSKLSQEIGVSVPTISSYYEILEDCLIAERIEPITVSKTRKKLTRSQKYLFFDLGVRRAAAKEGLRLPREIIAHLFEQFVGLELIRMARFAGSGARVRFWRDPSGPEVDWVIERNGEFTPVEVKWTDIPHLSDVKNIEIFLREYKTANVGYLVCRAERAAQMSDRVSAIPWQEIDSLIT